MHAKLPLRCAQMVRILNDFAVEGHGGKRTGYPHAVSSVGFTPKVLVPHFSHIVEGAPWCAQECTPAMSETLRIGSLEDLKCPYAEIAVQCLRPRTDRSTGLHHELSLVQKYTP